MTFLPRRHPWNPGYAVPKYVLAEPPERGTFTTQWLPRGTIPEIIPNYLAQRLGLARVGSLSGSSLSTSSLAGHAFKGNSLAGDSLGAQVYEVEPIAEVRARERAQAAFVNQLPAARRRRVLRHARNLRAGGMPMQNAIDVACAKELGYASPRSRSLRGSGRSHKALGADSGVLMTAPQFSVSTEGSATTTLPLMMAKGTVVAPEGPREGDCTADQAYIFLGGAWQRHVSERIGGPASAPCTRVTSYGAEVRYGQGGNVTVTDAQGNVQKTIVTMPPELQYIQVGPFVFPSTGGTVRVHNRELPVEWVKWFAEQVTQDYNAAWYAFWKPMSLKRDGTFVGKPGQMIGFIQDQVTGVVPIATVKHPITGEDWGIYIWNVDRYKTGEFDLSFQKVVDLPALKRAFTWLVTLPGKLWDKVCNRAYSEGEEERAAAAGPYAQAGHLVTKVLCGPPDAPVPPPEIPPPPSSTDGMLPYLIAGGAGLLIVTVLMKSRRRGR